MARIRFVGDSETCAWLGVKFVNGEWVEHHNLDAEQVARVADHPHFEVAKVDMPVKGSVSTEASAGKKA